MALITLEQAAHRRIDEAFADIDDVAMEQMAAEDGPLRVTDPSFAL